MNIIERFRQKKEARKQAEYLVQHGRTKELAQFQKRSDIRREADKIENKIKVQEAYEKEVQKVAIKKAKERGRLGVIGMIRKALPKAPRIVRRGGTYKRDRQSAFKFGNTENKSPFALGNSGGNKLKFLGDK